MNPNIYQYAHTEYAQDAFISWLCACFNQDINKAKKEIAKRFITELLGVDIEFTSVDIQNQYLNIDILLTLKTPDNESYYVIIEDKKFSKYHGEQLKRYIEVFSDKMGISRDKVFAVYYKTSHILKTPNTIYFKNKQFYYNTTIISEFDAVTAINNNPEPPRKLVICDLCRIYTFFQNEQIQVLIKNSGSEIIDDYSGNISEQFKSSNSTDLPAKTDHAEQNNIWGKVFDEFIRNNGNKYSNLSFKLDFYYGVYWEIYITEKVGETKCEKQFVQPILNIKSNMFKEKEPKIIFFLLPDDSPLICSNDKHWKKNKVSYAYTIKWGNIKKASFSENDFTQDRVSIDHFKQFLEVVCKEFSECIESKRNFDLYQLCPNTIS